MNWSSISPAPTATIPFTEPTTVWHSHTALDRTQITPYPSIDQLVAQQFESTSTLSCYVPNVVVLSIHTDVTISDYRSIYHDQDIYSFNPNYHATRDGSLLSSALSKDLKQGAQSLLMFGAYAIFFFSNSIAAVGFIPRTTAKSKAIFYTLLASQISAFLPWLLLIVSVFSPVLNCQAVLRAATFFLNTAVSLALSGVFGYKAYRCLFNSIFVLTGLSCFQIVRSSMLIVELIKLRAARGLNGICQYKDGSNSRLVPAMIIITFLEAVFIASCFLYAVLRSSHLLAAQGRLSFQESLKEPAPARDSERQDQQSLPSRRSGGMEPTRLIITTPTVVPAGLPPDAFNKEVAPLIPPGAISTRVPPFKAYRIWETLENWIKSFLGSPVVEVVTGSSIRQALFKPRLVLFREVIRDELCYTTVMAAATVVSATFATIGTFKWQGVFNVHEWGSLHLAVLSLLAVHSMRRVVRRNEQEKILQDPRFSDPMRRAARVGSRFDSLSFNSRITFHTTTRAPRSTNSSPIDLPGRSTLKRWTPRRGSVASQDSSRAMLNSSGTRPPSWDSTEFLPARRLSYSSISPRSSQSIEYLVPPLNTNSQDVPTSPHWSPIITPAAVYT